MKVQDIFYIGWYYNSLKGGKSWDIRERWGRSQYNQGGSKLLPSYVYFAHPAVQFPIDKLEMYYARDFYPYLKHQRGNFRKKLEFIDPRHTQITAETVRDTIEHHIRKDGLQVLRLKSDFIFTIPYTPSFSKDVREDYEKYCEKV